MTLTSLNLEAPKPALRRPKIMADVCPGCREKGRKITIASFGTHTEAICEHCGYAYKD